MGPQGVQAVLDAMGEYLPAGQAVQDTAPTIENWLGVGENVPGWQTEQALKPVDDVNVPASQIAHRSSPASE